MEISRYGFILNTGDYPACRAFYRDVIGLKVLFEKGTDRDGLICFDLSGAYLMVETGGTTAAKLKSPQECPSKLRLNTNDLAASVAHLRSHGVVVEEFDYSWGRTAEFMDPDGNRCALRTDHDFFD